MSSVGQGTGVSGVAGRRTLNRIELKREGIPSVERYKEVERDFDAVLRLFVETFPCHL